MTCPAQLKYACDGHLASHMIKAFGETDDQMDLQREVSGAIC